MLNTKGVTFQIDRVDRDFGDTPVLRDITLEARAGEFLCIVGRSGSGKTTLLKLLAGLDQPTGGRLNIGGQPLRGPHQAVRIMFQEARLLPWLSVVDNVLLGVGGASRAAAQPLLGRVGLAERAGDWPATLSGGQRQRVALARALAANPALLLLDEPLGSLDALTRIEMQRLLEDLWLERQFTALLITHDVDEAVTLADRVLLLEAGQFRAQWHIDLPRPRTPATPGFGRLVEHILERILSRSNSQSRTATDSNAHALSCLETESQPIA